MDNPLRNTIQQLITPLEGDYSDDEIAAALESLSRHYRQQDMSAIEAEWLAQIRACYEAQGLTRYFHASAIEMPVNLVNLEAYHWIEQLPPAQPLTIGFTNGQGRPYHDPNERYQNELRRAWRQGTPYRVTHRGHLSLAQGYVHYGLAIGEIVNGIDAFATRKETPDV